MNNDNKQIHNWESRGYTLAAADKGIASFTPGPLREFSTPAGTIQDAAAIPTSNPNSWLMDESWHVRSTSADSIQNAAIPTSNPDCMQLQIESSGGIVGVQEDSDNDNVLLPMEYPTLRYSPQSVFAKTGAWSQHPP